MKRASILVALLVSLVGGMYLLGQGAPQVSETFEGFVLGSTPAGWIDDLVGSLTARPHGFFQVAADPLAPSNHVLASSGDAGMERGAAVVRTGFVAHRLLPVFDSGASSFTYAGRVLRSSSDGAVGVTFLSAYPMGDAYYLLGCWPAGATGPDHFWLTGVGGALPGPPRDLGVSAPSGAWYRFRIQADAGTGGTRLRARVWPDGTAEPDSYNIDIVDSTSGRLSVGRIGFWASRKGIKALDDVVASGTAVIGVPTPTATPTSGGPNPTPTRTPTPGAGGGVVVRLTESGGPLPDGALFNRDVQPSWTIEGGTPPYTAVATLSGAPFSKGSTISAEGSYRLSVSATDSVGATAQAGASFSIDKTPPVFSNLRPDPATILGTRTVLFTGNVSPDAVSVTVGGRTAQLSGNFFSVPDLALAEGANQIPLVAVDLAGNVGSAMQTLTVDTIPPIVTVASPADHSVTKDGTITVTGTVTDASAVTLSVNGVAASITGTGMTRNFSATGVSLNEGPNPIVAAARDIAGNTSQTSITVDRDTVPPTIGILDGTHEIVEGDLFNRHPSPIIAVADAHLSGFTATLNGAPFVSGTLIPTDGSFSMDVDARDTAGNTAHKTVHFGVDTIAPRITNVVPADGALLTSSPQPVTGDCDDAVTVTVNGLTAAVSAGHFRIDAFSFSEGPVTLSFVGRDRAGNVGTASVSVIVDTQPPVVVIDQPAAGSYLKTTTATVTGTATDANLVSVSVNGVPAALAPGGAFTATGVALPEGPVTITATATDRGGRTGTASVSVTADRTPPQIAVTESGTTVTSGTVFRKHPKIVFTATDATPVSAHATLNGSPFVSGSEIDNDGSYDLEVNATDAAGNAAVKGVTFGVDATAPRITNLQPANGTITRQLQLPVSGDCDDAVTVTVAGVAASVSGGHFVAAVVPLSEGDNSLPISAKDAAGNEGTATLLLIRDTIPPQVVISSPAPDFLTAASTVTVTGTATDLHLSSVDVNGGAATLTGSNFRRDVPLTEGANTLTAVARDAAGNQGSASVSVTRDSTPPVVAITSPADGAVIGLPAIDVSGDVSDAHLDRVSVNGIPATISGGRFTATGVTLATGANTLTATATDRAGNSSTSSVHVTRDDSALSIAIDTPPSGARLRSQPITVAGSVSPAAVSVSVNGIAATIASGRFTATGVPLNQGANTLTARATDSGGKTGVATSTVYLDTIAPTVISVTPASDATDVLPGVVVRIVFSEAIDPATVTSSSVTLTPDAGGSPVAAALSVGGAEVDIVPVAALAERTRYRIDVTVAVADLAGNPLVQPFASRFTTGASSDPTTPILDPLPPAICAVSIPISGRADPGDRIRITGGITVVTTLTDSTGRFSASVDLNPDQVNGFEVVAFDAQNRQSKPATATVRADCTPPRVESARLDGDDLVITFSEAMDPQTVTLGPSGSVTLASASGELGSSIALSADGITARVTGSQPLSKQTFTLTVNRNAKDLVGNPLLSPFIQTFTPGVDVGLIGEVFDDAIGRPLPGAVVTVLAINGTPPPSPTPTATTDGDGRFALVVASGEISLQATRDGYTTVSRIEIVSPGQVTTVFDLRLTPLTSVAAAADGSAQITDGGLTLTLPAGSTAAAGPVRGAEILAQGLPSLPPLGWSPAAGLSFDFGATSTSRRTAVRAQARLASPASAEWKNRFAFGAGTSLLLAVDDPATRRYIAVGPATLSADGARIEASIPGPGSYVVFVADPAPYSPPAAVVGQPLAGVAPPASSPILSATVTTNPTAVLPTQTAEISAQLSLSAPVPSGYPVQALVSESLTLLDTRTVQVPAFLADLIVVRDGAGHALVPFRVRPSDTAAQVALSVGFENLQIKQYPFEVRRGDLLSPGGGVVSGAGGFSIAVSAGALTETVPVNLSPITDPGNLPVPIPDGFRFLSAIQLSLGGRSLALPASLRWGSASDPTAGGLVWLEVARIGGIARLQFVAPGRYDATNTWVETTPAAVHNLPLPGIAHGGLFVLLSAQSPLAVSYAKGRVLDVGGPPLPGAVVTEDANTLVVVSDSGGNYGLAVPAAGTFVRSQRIDTGNQGSAAVPAQAAGATASVDIPIAVTAPFVASVSPDPASLLPVDLPVVFTLSEPLDSTTVSLASVSVTGPSGTIPGAVRLSASGTQVTFQPTLPWPGKAQVSVTLLSTVTDRNGYRLVDRVSKTISNFTATFTTVDPTPPSDVNPLLIFMGLPQGSPSSVTITGAPGAACGGCNVTAINDTTQATASTQALGDGSFTLTLAASTTDLVSILIKRPGGGGEIKVSPGPFRSNDGRTAIVGTRAADYLTLDRIRVTMPDGTFSVPTTLRVTPIAEATLPAPVPSLSKYAGAVSFDAGTANGAFPIDVGVPAPPGVTGGTFLVARAVTVLGETRWMVVDTARYDNGEITTRPASGSSSVARALARLGGADSAKNLLDRVTRTSNLVFLGLTQEFAFLQANIQSPNCIVSFNFSAQYDFLSHFIPFVWVSKEAKQQTYFLVPIPTGADYTLVIRDSTTGFILFQGNFSALTDPSNITQLPPGATPSDLPAPRLASGSPFAAITFTPAPTKTGERRTLLPGIEYEFAVDADGKGNVSLFGAAGSVSPGVKATLQNNIGLASATVTTAPKGQASAGSFGPLSVAGKTGDDLTFTSGTSSLSLDSPILISFSQPFTREVLFADPASADSHKITLTDADAGNAPLAYQLTPGSNDPAGSRDFTLTPSVHFSRGHRIVLHIPGGDGAAQSAFKKPLPASIDIDLSAPKDETIGVRAVNDVNVLYLKGGLLLEATGDQQLNLYDASDPGHVQLPACSTKNLFAPARGLTMDDGGRILVSMGGGGTPGRLQVFLLGLTVDGGGPCGGRVLIDEEQLSLSFTELTVRTGTENPPLPEGFPRTIKLFNLDSRETVVFNRDIPKLVRFTPLSEGKFHVTGTIPPNSPPSTLLNQPATIFNRTTGRSWSAFADGTGNFALDAQATSGDSVEVVLNRAEIALVGTLSFGIQGVEVNRTMHRIGASCDSTGGPDSICLAKVRLLFSFGGKPDAFGAPPAVHFCREPDVHAGSSCVDLVTDLERLNDIDLLPASSSPGVSPAGKPLLVGAISRFGIGLFSISPIATGYQVDQVGDGAPIVDRSTTPAFYPQIFAVAAARDFPVKAKEDRRFCTTKTWPGKTRSLAFAAAGSSGVYVVDVTDATAPEAIGVFKVTDSSAQANTLAVDSKRGLLYVGLGGEGIVVYDMTDPCTLGTAPPTDPRVLSRVPVVNANVNVPFVLDSDTGILFGAADAGEGAPPGSGKSFTLSPVDPPLRFVADTDRNGVFEEVSSAIPLGVSNPDVLPPPVRPSVVRLLASVMGSAGKEIVVPIASTSETGVTLPPSWSAMARTKSYVSLKRQSDDPADPGYNRYLSPPIVLIADERARKAYNLSSAEDSAKDGNDNENACRQCSPNLPGFSYDTELAALASPPPPDNDGHDAAHPLQQAFEVFTGYKLVARLEDNQTIAPTRLEDRATYLQEHDPSQVRVELPTAPGDLSPNLAQMPRVNSSTISDEVGSQVVLSSGELTFGGRDLFIAGREGNDFRLERFYSSGAIHFGPFGQNWDSTLFARLRDLPSGDVEYYDGTLRRETFHFVPGATGQPGSFDPPPGRFAELYRLPDRTFFLMERDKSTLRFSEEGRLISISDRVRTSESEDVGDGNRIRFFYDGAGRLSVVTDSLGHRIRFEYYADTEKPGDQGKYPDLIASVTDHTDRSVLYHYDDKGRLTEVLLPEIASNGTGPPFTGGSRRKLAYKYSDVAGSELRHTLHESNNLISAKNARDTEVLSVEYDDSVGFGAKENVVTRKIAGTAETFTYKASDHSATYTDRRGHIWQFVHDADGHATSMTLSSNDTADANPPATPPPALALPGGTVPAGPFTTATTYKDPSNHHHDGLTDEVTLPSGRNTSYAYQAPDPGKRNRANVTGETADGPGAKKSLTDQFDYQSIVNQVKSHTDPAGGTVTFDRDPQKGFPNKITLPDSLGPDGTPRTPGFNLMHDATTGQPMSVKDFAGVGTTLEYFDKTDPAYGYLQTVTEKGDGSIYPVTAASVTQFERDARGNLKSRTDPRGVKTTYEINEADQVVKITEAAATTSSLIPPLSIVRTFEYDADGNLVKETWPQAPLGTVTRTHQYDDLSRRTQTTEAVGAGEEATTSFTYDSVGNLVMVTNPEGERDVSAYDARNLSVGQERISAGGDLASSVHSLARDEDGRVVEDFDGVNTRTGIHYDGIGRPDQITTPRGALVSVEYDDADRPTHVTVTDPAAKILKERRTDYALSGQVIKQTDLLRKTPADSSTDVVTLFGYDEGGRLRQVTDPQGRATLRNYDDHGRLQRTEDAVHNISLFGYDTGGNLTTRTDQEIKADSTYEADRQETAEFDAVSRMTRRVDPLSHEMKYTYDEPGNLLSAADARTHTTSYGYDARSRRTSMTDALTNKTIWTWDKDSRMTSMVDANGADHTTFYHYDSIGRLKDILYPDLQSELRTYNGDGTVDTATDQNGTISRFFYDADDQPNKITYELHGAAAGMTQETFGYDALGRLTSAASNAGVGGSSHTTSRSYDSLDRVLSETQDSRTVTREFDLVGNPTKTTYPGSSRIFQRSYDALDRLQQVNEWLDPAGNTRRAVRGYEYVGPNRIARETVSGSNLQSVYGYDAARRLTSLTSTDNRVTKDFLKYLYAWQDDDVPAVEQRLHEAGKGDAWTHDADHRLTVAGLSQAIATGPPTITPPDGSARNRQQLSLGSVHERKADALTLAGTTSSRSVTTNPRYGYTVYGPDNGRAYDKAGSLTKDARATYVWDARHRLVEADLSDGTVLQYGYDALGRRVEKKKTLSGNSTTTAFFFDGWNAVEEFSDGTLSRETVFGSGLDDSVEYRIAGRDYQLFRDRTGSTGAVVDDDGTTHLFKYLSFGKASVIDGSGDYNFDLSGSTTSSLWQGLELDPDLGWYYARNRWSDPETGSFTSADPLGYPDSANPYVWGVGSPWARDPEGLCDDLPCAVARTKGEAEKVFGGVKRSLIRGYEETSSALGLAAKTSFGFQIGFAKSELNQLVEFAEARYVLGHRSRFGSGAQRWARRTEARYVFHVALLVLAARGMAAEAEAGPAAAESSGAETAGVLSPEFIESAGAAPRGGNFVSATAQTARSGRTSIMADLTEKDAYYEALSRGEIGLQRPLGANTQGPDFITAARSSQTGQMEVIVNDVKARTTGRFPKPATSPKSQWLNDVNDAVSPERLKIGNPQLESEIQAAAKAGRVRVRQINVDKSPAGQGKMTGF